jgi:hypothetical protein
MRRSTTGAAYNSPMNPIRSRLASVVIAGVMVIMHGFFPDPKYDAHGILTHDMRIGRANAAELSEGEKNFFLLRDYYTKWHDGLFGSKKYHKRKLLHLLQGMIGKEIVTEYDFMLVSPEGVIDKTVACNFQWGRWLHVHGELDAESAKNVAGSNYKVLREWSRSGILVALSGRLKKFKLDWDAAGDTVHIYLDKVRLLK